MSKSLPFRVFGIRHHGPGSARRLKTALDAWQPDHILIEAPADVQTELIQIQTLALEPPVALVVYNEKNIQEALYYPFASFSPEWQAIRWSQINDIPFTPFDLPAFNQLSFSTNKQLSLTPAVPTTVQRDPLHQIAEIAGYKDTEQWWDNTFEKSLDDLALFETVNELIHELRKANPSYNSPETLTREAYMRKILRKTIKAGAQRIAIVCGAWHGPALSELPRFPATKDNQRLRGLNKIRTKTAWIPWSYPRLAKQGGYGAGVQSPAWYSLLHDHGVQATENWMVKAAQMLRKEQMDVSPAHAQEGVKLARALAYMNGHAIPGLSDMKDAALSILCQGNEMQFDLIETNLILGDKVGRVPENASVVPLQKDLQKQLKSARLSKYWGLVGTQWLKATKANKTGFIDLREAKDLQKSELLHQLIILDTPWGMRQANNSRSLGAFKEIWQLNWKPEFTLNIIEAAMWGNTLKEAAKRKILSLENDSKLADLSAHILLGLRAGLGRAVAPLIEKLETRAALTKDAHELLLGISAIIQIIQYGDARKTDVTVLAQLIAQLVPRLAANLSSLFSSIDDDFAQALMKDLLKTHRAILLLEDDTVANEHWWTAIHQLSEKEAIHPRIIGLATRLLFDQQKIDLSEMETQMTFALSKNTAPNNIGQWLGGFLHGSGLILLHHKNLWSLLNNWVKTLEWETLQEILPLLRRTFAAFTKNDRQQILRLVKSTKPEKIDVLPQEFSLPNSASLARKQVLLAGIQHWIK